MAMNLLRGVRRLAASAVLISGSIASLANAQEFVLAGIYPEGDPPHAALLEIAERVAAETEGRVTFKTFPSGELGDYTSIYEEVRRGTIPFALMPIPSQFDPRFEVTSLGYAAKTIEEAQDRNSVGGYLQTKLAGFHEALGVKLVGGLLPVGFGGIALMTLPENIEDPAAAKDLLIRIPPMDVYKKLGEALGFQTVTINFGDLPTAMQTGVADGWVGGNATINYLLFRDLIKYYVVANLYFEAHSFVANAEAWDRIPEADRAIITEVVNDVTTKAYAETEAREEENLRKMQEENGIEIVRFSPETIAVWSDYVRTNVWPQLEERLTPELLNGLK